MNKLTIIPAMLLFFATAHGQWRIFDEEDAQRFRAHLSNEDGSSTLTILSSLGVYVVQVYWDSNVVGTDRLQWTYWPVRLKWSGPDLEHSSEWIGSWYNDGDYEDASISSRLNHLNPKETELFLERMTQHESVEVSILGSDGLPEVSTRFVLEGAPEIEDVLKYARAPGNHGFYFSDFVVGGGWSVQLVVQNTDPESTATVGVIPLSNDGPPFQGLFESEHPYGLVRLEIPPLGTHIINSLETQEVHRGAIWVWPTRSETEDVHGVLTYRHEETGVEVGVAPVPLGTHFALYVEETDDIGTGLATFLLDQEDDLELLLRDVEGQDLPDGEVSLSVPNQSAQTIPEWFRETELDLEDFRGTLYLRTTGGSLFAPLGLRFGKRQGSLSAVPVVRIEE